MTRLDLVRAKPRTMGRTRATELALVLGTLEFLTPAPARAEAAPGEQAGARAAMTRAASSAPAAPAQTRPPAPTHASGDPNGETGASLGRLLAHAERHSPVLLVARSTRSRAEAARVAASVGLAKNPSISLAAGPRFGAAGTGVDVEAGVWQELRVAGERGRRQQAAERLRELTDAEIAVMSWAVHCDVHAAFHQSLVEGARAQLAERVVAFQEEVLRIVEQQIAAGETAPLTLRLAQAEVLQAEQVRVAAQQAFYASRVRLAQLTGWPVDQPPTPRGPVDTPRDPPSQEALRAAAEEHLPSLRAQSVRVRETEARLRVAAREAWPRPSLGVQYRREGNPSAEGAYDIVLGGLSLSLPLAQLNQGEKAAARAERAVAEAELAATRQLLAGRIALARSEVSAAAVRARAYGAEILPRFEENLTLLRRSFELGEIDLLALSTGRERFLRIQSDALGAQQDYFVALSGLERVVGVDLLHDDEHEEEP